MRLHQENFKVKGCFIVIFVGVTLSDHVVEVNGVTVVNDEVMVFVAVMDEILMVVNGIHGAVEEILTEKNHVEGTFVYTIYVEGNFVLEIFAVMIYAEGILNVQEIYAQEIHLEGIYAQENHVEGIFVCTIYVEGILNVENVFYIWKEGIFVGIHVEGILNAEVIDEILMVNYTYRGVVEEMERREKYFVCNLEIVNELEIWNGPVEAIGETESGFVVENSCAETLNGLLGADYFSEENGAICEMEKFLGDNCLAVMIYVEGILNQREIYEEKESDFLENGDVETASGVKKFYEILKVPFVEEKWKEIFGKMNEDESVGVVLYQTETNQMMSQMMNQNQMMNQRNYH